MPRMSTRLLIPLLFNAGIRLLLRDDFVTDDAAPLTSPRTAEPGPGEWVVTEIDGSLVISGERLNITAPTTVGWNELGMYTSAALSNDGSNALVLAIIDIDYSTIGSGGDTFCFANAQTLNFDASNNVESGLRVYAGAAQSVADNAVALDLESNLFGTTDNYHTFVVLLPTLTFIYTAIVGSDYKLVSAKSGTFEASVYAAFSSHSNSMTLDNLRIAELSASLFNPAIAQASPSVGALPDLPDGDFVCQFTATAIPSGGSIFIRVREQDFNNYWNFELNNGGTLKLHEVVAGASTQRASTAGGFAAIGNQITLITRGNIITAFANNTQAWTYTSANNFLREVGFELNSLGTGGVINNLKVWKAYARDESGLGSELVVNGGFDTDTDWTKGTGWTISGGVATHASGTGSDLSQAVLTSGSTYYELTFTISGHTTGTLTPKFGTNSLAAISADGTYTVYGIANGTGLALTASSTFDGSIDNVSVKEVQFIPDILGKKLNQVVS